MCRTRTDDPGWDRSSHEQSHSRDQPGRGRGPLGARRGHGDPPARIATYRDDGTENLTYNNPYNLDIERVWFDGKVVYAVEQGELELAFDENREPVDNKVAQEYQIVYAVELDEAGKLKNGREPDRVEGQYNIYDSVPGMDKYSPLWQFNYVIVPRDYEAEHAPLRGRTARRAATRSSRAPSSRIDRSSERRRARRTTYPWERGASSPPRSNDAAPTRPTAALPGAETTPAGEPPRSPRPGRAARTAPAAG